MKIEVEVISNETIKPSSPTPDHLRHYQLSFLDQISPPVYIPLVLFYSKDIDNNGDFEFNKDHISNRLKNSLSEILTHFYPLAGRQNNDKRFVDCNDDGIPYSEARVNCQLSDFIQNPVPAELNKLIPFEVDGFTDFVFGVQLNIFSCGGVAIGACISHLIADGLSYFTFIKSWAATSRGKTDFLPPQFVSATLFPPKNTNGYDSRVGIVKENIVTKRFVFGASTIEALRAKYGNSKGLENQKPPSRVEALSAFMWSRFVAATKVESSGTKKIYLVVHAVNLRPRIHPPLPETSFGNLYRVAFTVSSTLNSDQEEYCYGIVSRVREEISKIDKEYVKKLQDGAEHFDFIMDRSKKVVQGEIVTFNITSFCKFPLYDSDFGWGKPAWVGTPGLTFNNLVVFIDTKSGDGIEAYVNLKKEDMAKFEVDKELLAHVSPTCY